MIKFHSFYTIFQIVSFFVSLIHNRIALILISFYEYFIHFTSTIYRHSNKLSIMRKTLAFSKLATSILPKIKHMTLWVAYCYVINIFCIYHTHTYIVNKRQSYMIYMIGYNIGKNYFETKKKCTKLLDSVALYFEFFHSLYFSFNGNFIKKICSIAYRI